MHDDPTSVQEILRGTSDQLVIAVAETAAFERKKRGVRPSDPDFPQLALEVRRAAERVLELARREEIVARNTYEEPRSATLPPIEHMSPAKELGAILEEWRAVEHQMLAAEPGTSVEEELRHRFDELRDRYAHALEERKRRD